MSSCWHSLLFLSLLLPQSDLESLPGRESGDDALGSPNTLGTRSHFLPLRRRRSRGVRHAPHSFRELRALPGPL